MRLFQMHTLAQALKELKDQSEIASLLGASSSRAHPPPFFPFLSFLFSPFPFVSFDST